MAWDDIGHSALLARLSGAGLTGIGVSCALGGAGGTLRDAADAVLALARSSERAAVVLACQRQFIEVLLRGRNVAARAHRLPYAIEGQVPAACAVTWPAGAMTAPLRARNTGRGWRLAGHLPPLPNLGGDWFMAAVPVDFGAGAYAMVSLSSDEDGIMVERPSSEPAGIACGQATLRDVFFREDEILEADGPGLAAAVEPFALALRAAIVAGATLGDPPQGEARVLALYAQVAAVLDGASPDAARASLQALRQLRAQALVPDPLA